MCLASDTPEHSGSEKKTHLMGTVARSLNAPLTSYDSKTSTAPCAFYRTFQMPALLGTATKHLKKESSSQVKCYI